MREEVRVTLIVVAVSSLVLTCPIFGFAAWFFYDATVTYPQQQQQAQIYEQFWYSGVEDWYEQWEAYAQQQGWSTQPPASIDDEDIFIQYLCAGLCSFTGIFFVAIAAALGFIVHRHKPPAQPMA